MAQQAAGALTLNVQGVEWMSDVGAPAGRQRYERQRCRLDTVSKTTARMNALKRARVCCELLIFTLVVYNDGQEKNIFQ